MYHTDKLNFIKEANLFKWFTIFNNKDLISSSSFLFSACTQVIKVRYHLNQ